MVKVRDGQVANRPIYAAIGVSLAGDKGVRRMCSGCGPAPGTVSSGLGQWLSGASDGGWIASWVMAAFDAANGARLPARGMLRW